MNLTLLLAVNLVINTFMAHFNPEVQGANSEPNYLRYSQGKGEDHASGHLLKSIANVGGGVADLFDDIIQNKAKQEVATAVTGVQKPSTTNTPTGGEDTLDSSGDTESDVPDSTRQYSKNIQKAHAAYKSGRWTDSQYWAYLDAKTSEIKARFPGYSNVIDASIKSQTGHTPADMLVQAKFKKVADEQAQAERPDKKLLSYVLQHPEAIQPDWWERKAKGQPYTADQTYAYGSKYIAQEHQRDAQKKNILQAITERKDTTEQAARLHNQEINQFTDRMLLDATDPFASRFKKAFDTVTSKKDTASPQENEELRQAFIQLENHWMDGIRKINSAAFSGDPTKSYYTLVDQKDIAANEAQAKQRISMYKEMIGQGHWGMLEANKRLVQDRENADVKSLLDNHKVLRLDKALKTIGASDAFNRALMTDKEIQNAYAGAHFYKSLIENMTDVNSPGIKQNFQEIQQKNQDETAKGPAGKPISGADYKEMLNRYKNTLANPLTTKETFSNLVSNIYGDKNEGFFGMFKPRDRETVYSTLLSPDVTRRVSEMAAHDPKVWDQYKKTALTGFFGIFKADLDDITEKARDNVYDVSYDEKSNQFKVVTNKNYLEGEPKYVGKQVTTFEPVNKINRQLKILEPILQRDKESAGETLGKMFEAMAVIPDDGNRGTLPQKLYAAIRAGVKTLAQESLDARDARSQAGFTPTSTGVAGAMLRSFKDAGYDPSLNPFKPDNREDTANTHPIDLSQVVNSKGNLKPLLDLIRQGESDNQYGQVFGDPREWNLQEHTLDEVIQLQKMRKSSGQPSTAVGGYQIISNTLQGLKKELKLTGDEKFTPELQDSLAQALLHRRGLGHLQSGKKSVEDFAKSLAQEFAALPLSTGKSYYHGDGLNKSRIKYKDLVDAIKQALQQ